MIPPKLSQALQLVASTAIVTAAVCIVLPDLLNYLSGVWRLLLWIALVLLTAVSMAAVWVRLKAGKKV